MRRFGRFAAAKGDLILDEGMHSQAALLKWRDDPFLEECGFRAGEDSKKIRGLQLADHCAHMASAILLCDLGQISKKVPAGMLPFDQKERFNLDFPMWFQFRRALASNVRTYPGEDRSPTAFADYDAFGPFVSQRCPPQVIEAALSRFGSIYMGCLL